MRLGISRVSSKITDQLTDTLYGTTKDEDWHTLSNSADKTTEFEEEDSAEEDVFGFDHGEELTDEKDETTLGYCWLEMMICGWRNIRK